MRPRYRNRTLDDLNRLIESYAKQTGVEVSFFQSYHQGDIIEAVHRAGLGKNHERFDALVGGEE